MTELEQMTVEAIRVSTLRAIDAKLRGTSSEAQLALSRAERTFQKLASDLPSHNRTVRQVREAIEGAKNVLSQSTRSRVGRAVRACARMGT
jgi:hypothetical protein